VLLAALLGALAVPALAHADPLTVGAYYYPWYGTGSAQWSRGDVRADLASPQQPLLGTYDSRDPAVIAQHYAWAQEYGVDVFFCSWAGPGSFDDVTIRDHLLPSPARGPTQVALLYESLQRLGIGPDARIHLNAQLIARLVSDFDYAARTYFGDPGYYRIHGRPVVVIYASRIFRGPIADAIHAIRRRLISAYGVNPYLIGDEVDWDNPPDPARIRLFDAITGYTLYSRTQASGWPSSTRFLQAVGRRVLQFRAVAEAEGVGFVPGALPGFNDRGVRPQDDHHVLPRQLDPSSTQDSLFESSLDFAGTLVDPAVGLLAVTSWNEWQEDTQIEPTAPAPASDGPFALTQGYVYTSYGTTLLERLAAFKQSWERSRRFPRVGAAQPS
jgi:glycoprotein endo-alpha-1,2-mannosidase